MFSATGDYLTFPIATIIPTQTERARDISGHATDPGILSLKVKYSEGRLIAIGIAYGNVYQNDA